MNFNKCERCGCFFATDSSTCPSCSTKDNIEMNQLKSFLIGNSTISKNIINNVSTISSQTGITVKNLNRFLNNKTFASGIDSVIKTVNTNINL